MSSNPIADFLDEQLTQTPSEVPNAGSISSLLGEYDAAGSMRLLGFLLDMNYDELRFVTCDAWKRKCGGVPRNSFVIVKLNAKAAGVPAAAADRFLILARVSETAPTPVANDIQSTIFQIHKVQATIDPFTNAELQWGALKADILGTYFDRDGRVQFGNDVDNFMSPHFYEVYVPTPEHLEHLINSFVADSNPIKIGRLRYTETETLAVGKEIAVRVSPADFVANRTALFGKTRMGKSNTIKVILDTMLHMPATIGQVVFDLSGEYTYPDKQTGASLYLRHQNKCTRYSLKPRVISAEAAAGASPPAMLRANFYRQVELGHQMISSLWDTVHPNRPDYVAPLLGWEPTDLHDVDNRFSEFSDRTRVKRALSMYFALLHEAGFPYREHPSSPALTVKLEINQALRERLGGMQGVANFAAMDTKKPGAVAEQQTVEVAARLYERLYELYKATPQDPVIFPVGSAGKDYFDPIHKTLLRMLGDRAISGAKKLTPFRAYHHPEGGDIVRAITQDVERGKTVLIDLANADPQIARYYSDMVSKAILTRQMTKFSEQETAEFEQHSVLFYFEEAHNLFRSDDKDLTSVYNKLAKEGAKFRIGMVYATQSMTTLSPDLLKNTENFFIAHLNDDREIKEIERRYEFAGIGLDVQRARSKGYVRMITLSHRYALPVQIKLFDPTEMQEALSNQQQ